jgi:hypothetical protein
MPRRPTPVRRDRGNAAEGRAVFEDLRNPPTGRKRRSQGDGRWLRLFRDGKHFMSAAVVVLKPENFSKSALHD